MSKRRPLVLQGAPKRKHGGLLSSLLCESRRVAAPGPFLYSQPARLGILFEC